MNGKATIPALVLASGTLLSGCSAIETIFKAGVWTGLLAVIVVLALIGGGVALFSRGR